MFLSIVLIWFLASDFPCAANRIKVD
jgi:hypothetical protein